MPNVNGHVTDTGCYVAGHNGQYAPDRAADVAENFGYNPDFRDDPRVIRYFADNSTDPGLWDFYHWADDATLEWLNAVTDPDHHWHWHEGELFLTNTNDIEDYM